MLLIQISLHLLIANGPEYTLTDQLTLQDMDSPQLTPAILRPTILKWSATQFDALFILSLFRQ
jgi:hypothetical protein